MEIAQLIAGAVIVAAVSVFCAAVKKVCRKLYGRKANMNNL